MTDRDDADAPPDGRSMSEILASIRRIVSDEERARREAERRRIAGAGGAQVLELTHSMRAHSSVETEPGEGAAEPDGEGLEGARHDPLVPLDLGVAARLVSPPARFAPTSGLSAEEVEEIVRRVVREELRGPIGLEISRKVKASIREEVRRALDEDEDPLI